jgi:prevent-host-death family protein
MRRIPQRELRNQIARVLRQVEAGERLRVTVDGRPVADLVPIGDTKRSFVSREEVARLLADAPLDPGFADDLESATGATVEEL